ncbi:hypothetical protein A8O28_10125 [Enterobacteriaceae bacterium CCUG 67584]|nr:hypothetical protein [Enterobacteriaceae bacterium CCUG 67584]
MNIYISDGSSLTFDEYEGNKIHIIPFEEWLSVLKSGRQDDLVIWRYRYPWNDDQQVDFLKSLQFEKWNSKQQKVLNSVKDTKRFALFNEDLMSLEDVLEKIVNSSESQKKPYTVENHISDIDNLMLSVMYVWGKQYWKTLERLEKISLTSNIFKHAIKNNFSRKSKDILSSWLATISNANNIKIENDAVNKKIDKGINELVQLTCSLEASYKKNRICNDYLNADIAFQGTNFENSSAEKSLAETELIQLQQHYKALQIESEATFSELAKYKSLNVDITKKQISLENDIQQKNKSITTLEEEISKLKLTNEEQKNKIIELTSESEIYKKSLNERFSELAAITNMLEGSRRDVIKLQDQLSSATQKTDNIRNGLLRKTTASLRVLSNPRNLNKKKQNNKIKKSVELIKNSELFDTEWYLTQYPDVKDSGIDPARHYLLFGGFEQRDPSALFSSQGYLDLYTDVKESGMNPLVHYICFGRNEERVITPEK